MASSAQHTGTPNLNNPATSSLNSKNATLSFQLPDLLALTRPFPFRINKHCKFATDASENWFLNTQNVRVLLTQNELNSLRSMKYGLLAALCFPTCDAPQLHTLTDVLTVLFTSNARLYTGLNDGGWLESQRDPAHVEGVTDGLLMLERHPILRSITPRLSRLVPSLQPAAKSQWEARLASSINAYLQTQLSMQHNFTNGVQPSLPEYIPLRRELYGPSIIFDIAELLEICARPRGRVAKEDEKIDKITKCALDIVAWSFDIFSYPTTSTSSVATSPHSTQHSNLIHLLIIYRKLSVQGAVNTAGSMIKEALEEFHQIERELLALPNDTERSTGWLWLESARSLIGLGKYTSGVMANGHDLGKEDSGVEDLDERGAVLLKAYIQSLKDYIAGSINWGYETEMFFGQKGDEVRTFGWVFPSGNDPRNVNK